MFSQQVCRLDRYSQLTATDLDIKEQFGAYNVGKALGRTRIEFGDAHRVNGDVIWIVFLWYNGLVQIEVFPTIE